VSQAEGVQAAAWAWREHLRRGGTTEWAQWVRSAPDPAPYADPPPGWQVPGAAQLELVRRLAAAGRLHGAAFTRLADLVLSRSGPGRGLAQQPLAVPGGAAPRYGPPPVDPAQVPERELLRLAVGVLVELLLEAPVPPPLEPGPGRLRRLLGRSWPAGRPSFHVTGAPVTASLVREQLRHAGHQEGGRTPAVVVLAAPFDEVLAEAWAARVQRGAAVRWRGFLRRWSGRPGLPSSADLTAVAQHWGQRVGPARVHVVVRGDRSRAAGLVADVLGLGDVPDPGTGAPRPLSAAGVDVVRRVNAVLGVRVDPVRHREVLPSLREAVARAPVAGTASLTLPEPLRDWARSRAERLHEGLSAGGYRVHGDLQALVPVFAGPTRPDVGEAVRVALGACLSLAAVTEGTGRP